MQRHPESQLRLGAAEARVANPHGPGAGHLAEGRKRAVDVGGRPLAPKLVQAVAEPVRRILAGEVAVAVQGKRLILIDRATN